jgi:hypothetical protein
MFRIASKCKPALKFNTQSKRLFTTTHIAKNVPQSIGAKEWVGQYIVRPVIHVTGVSAFAMLMGVSAGCVLAVAALYLEEQEKHEKFAVKRTMDLDIHKMRQLFRDMVWEDTPGHYIDLSKEVVLQRRGKETLIKTPHVELSPSTPGQDPITERTLRLFDHAIYSKYHRKNNLDARRIHSEYHNQLVHLIHTLHCIEKLNLKKYDARFYHAKVELDYLGEYFKKTAQLLEKKTITHDPSQKICEKLENSRETMMWACDFFFPKHATDERYKGINIMYEKFKALETPAVESK